MRARFLLALAIMALVPGTFRTGAQVAPPASVPARVAIFYEPAFPAIDGPAVDAGTLRSAMTLFDATVYGAVELAAALDAGRVDVLVLPFGSAFPRDAWPSIFRFLSGGGSFVNLGGVPFAVPVDPAAGGWRAAAPTTSYFKQLGIVQAFPVAASGLTFRAADQQDVAARPLAADTRARRIFELIVRFTDAKTYPDEDGSDGARDATLTPLVHGFAGGREIPVAAPLVQIDRLDGRFAGGTWLLATSDLGVSPQAAAALVARAAEHAAELRVQPRYAGFRPGEPIDVTVSLRRPKDVPQSAAQLAADVQVTDEQGRAIASASVPLPAAGRLATAQVTLPIDTRTLARGLYRVRASVRASTGSARTERGAVHLERFDSPDPVRPEPFDSRTAPPVRPEPFDSRTAPPVRPEPFDSRTAPPVRPEPVEGRTQATSGFWIYDDAMLRGGRGIAAGRDYFTRDGVPFPVAGTTYMASDVHRRFLLEPNAWAWQRDFAAMAQAGVNLVRTGIWTGWSEHSAADGQPTEAMLRALDVFLLTARAHDIPVIFTFFAFVPPAWGGGNPYFEPRALAAQRRFAGAIAARLAGANDVAWDLINEPSFSSPERLWQCRPSYDADEQVAWEAWLRDTTPAGDARDLERVLAARWNTVAGDGLALPALHDFRDANLFGTARPNKAADYRRFAQAAFTTWVRGLTAAIRANGNPSQLVTVGQDEGGAGERPNPLLFGDAVDFTGTHTWWNNDALLWDGVVSKRPDRPALVEETGLMTYERPDGTPWRSEEEARNLLERKLALAIASGAGGFVQWLWNTNVYMPLDNEAGIGLLRADGTAKPELAAFEDAASFLRANRQRFTGRELEDVAVVVPQSEVLSVRDYGTAAMQRAVRSLEYELRVPVRVLNEYATADLRRGARLMILPSPRILTQSAWSALLDAVTAGSTLLVTGPIDRDEYERPVARLAQLGIEATTRPVAPENLLRLDGMRSIRVPFRGGKLERLERAAPPAGAPSRVEVVQRGKGRIVWCPLPVELSDDDRATMSVYRLATGLAGVRPAVTVTSAAERTGVAAAGILVRPLRLADGVLLVVVNETSADADLRVQIDGVARPVRVRVAAERATMVMVDRRTGSRRRTTRP